MTFTEAILLVQAVALLTIVLAAAARFHRLFTTAITTGVMLTQLYIVDRAFALVSPAWADLWSEIWR